MILYIGAHCFTLQTTFWFTYGRGPREVYKCSNGWASRNTLHHIKILTLASQPLSYDKPHCLPSYRRFPWTFFKKYGSSTHPLKKRHSENITWIKSSVLSKNNNISGYKSLLFIDYLCTFTSLILNLHITLKNRKIRYHSIWHRLLRFHKESLQYTRWRSILIQCL